MQVSVPKKVSRFGSSTAIYLDLPTITYLNLLNDDDTLRPVNVSVNGKEIYKSLKWKKQGSVVMTFTKAESEMLGLTYDDVLLFTISD